MKLRYWKLTRLKLMQIQWKTTFEYKKINAKEKGEFHNKGN